MKNNEWKAAERSCRQLVKNHQEIAEAHILFSSILAHQENRLEAIAHAKEARRLDPNSIDALIQLVDIAGVIDESDIDSGISAYNDFIQARPNEWRAHTQLGLLYLQRADEEEAIRCFNKAINLDKTQPDPVAALGKLYLQKQDYANALETYKKAEELTLLMETPISFKEELFTCRMEFAKKEISLKNHKKALLSYRDAMISAPVGKEDEAVLAILNLGDLTKENDLPFACIAYKLVLPRLTPEIIAVSHLTQIYLKLAFEASNKQAYKEATDHLHEAQSKDPDNLQILQHLAGIYRKTNDTKQLEVTLKQIIDIGKGDANTHTEIGSLYVKQGKFGTGLQFYRSAASLAPEHTFDFEISNCLLAIAEEFRKNQEYENTISFYKQAIAFPEKTIEENINKITKNSIGIGDKLYNSNINLALAAYQLAIPQFDNILISDQKKIEIFLKLGQKEQTRKIYDKASEWYLKGLSINPQELTLLANLISCYKDLNDAKLLEKYLKQGLAINPNNEEWVLSLGSLYLQQGDEEASAELFERLNTIEKTKDNLERLFKDKVEFGNYYLIKEKSTAQEIRKDLINFINETLSSPEGKKIIQSLGMALGMVLGTVLGRFSEENIELQNLGKNAILPKDIDYQTRRAFELIKKAYDGIDYHMKKEEMPKALMEKINFLEEKINCMRKHFTILKRATDSLINTARATQFCNDFDQWQPLNQSDEQDLEHSTEIEDRAMQVMNLVSNKILSPLENIPKKLQTSIEVLRNAIFPSAWIPLAIENYLEACALKPQEYGPHWHGLIQAYSLLGDHENTIKIYHRFKELFPQYPLRINPDSYIYATKNLLLTDKKKLALEQINEAVQQWPDDASLKQLQSHVNFTIGNLLYTKKHKEEAKVYFEKAIACCNTPEPACHFQLSEIYEEMAKTGEADKTTCAKKCLEHRKIAADRAKNISQYQFEYGRALYFSLIPPEDLIPYLKRAVELDPKNVTYAFGLLKALVRNDPEFDLEETIEAINHFKSLGGDVYQDYWHE